MSERTIRITIDPTGAERGAIRVRGALQGVGRQAEASAAGVGRLGTSLRECAEQHMTGLAGRAPLVGGALSSMGAAIAGAAAALVGFGAALVDGIRASEDFARAQRVLSVTLAGASERLGYTRQALVAMAFELEGQLAISKEAIIQAQSALVTFEGVTASTFPRIIRLAADMAAVFGGDLQRNVEILGTAIQNIASGEVQGLSRGLRFLGQETLSTISALAAAGQTAAATERLLGVLEQRIGGAASAQAGGLTGATFRLRDAWGELKRELADSLGAAGAATGLFDGLASGLTNVQALLRALRTDFGGFARDLLITWSSPVLPFGWRRLGRRIQEARDGGDLAARMDARAQEEQVWASKLADYRERQAAASERDSLAVMRSAQYAKAGAAAARAKADVSERLLASLERQAEIERVLAEQGRGAAEIMELQLQLGRHLSEQEHARAEAAILLRDMYRQQAAAMQQLGQNATAALEALRSEPLRPGVERRTDALGAIVANIDTRRDAEWMGRGIADGFRDRGLAAAQAIGQAIGGVAGSAISKAIGLIRGLATGDFTAMGGPAGGLLTLVVGAGGPLAAGIRQALLPVGDELRRLSRRLADVLGIGGSAAQGIGGFLGTAGIGLGIGALLGGGAGRQIGGAAGSVIGGAVLGPLGKLAGGVLGAIFGGLFGRVRRGSVSLSTSIAGVDIGAAVGTNRQRMEAATQLGGAFGRSLQQIADALGATLVPGVGLGSIGIRKDRFVFDPSGANRTKGRGVLQFATEQAAIEAALRFALQRGVLDNISDFSRRVLSAAGSIDQAVSVASRWEQVLRQLDEAADPFGAAARNATRDLDRLAREMQQLGATSDELGRLEQLRTLSLKRAREDALKGLRDFRESLFGEGSGVTALSRLAVAQQQFEAMRSAFGTDAFNQQEFSRLGQLVFSLAREVYGTATAEFQAIRRALISDTEQIIAGAERAFAEAAPVVDAIDKGTQVALAMHQQLLVANQYLAQIASAGGLGYAETAAINGALPAGVR